jgi:hypothetical protein
MSARPLSNTEGLSDLDREIDAFLEAEDHSDSDSFADLSLMPTPLVPRKRVDRRLYADSVADVGAILVVEASTNPRTRQDSLSPEGSPWERQAQKGRISGNDLQQQYKRTEVPPDSPGSPSLKQSPYVGPSNPPAWKPPEFESRYGREQRLAYIGVTQPKGLGHSLSSLPERQMKENDGYASPVELLHVKFESSNELPHTLEHRPLLPLRLQLRPPVHVGQSAGDSSISRVDFAPTNPDQHERNALNHAGDTPALTSRVRSPSLSVPRGKAFHRQKYVFHDNGEGCSTGPFYKETDPVSGRAKTYLNLIDEIVPSSSSSSEQTRGPPSSTNLPAPMLNHMQAFEVLRQKAHRREAKRIKAEQEAHTFALGGELVARAGIPFEKVRPAVIQARLKQGLQKPAGFFGLEDVDAERQANFELALDRMYGKIPDEYSANDWLEAERAGGVGGAENGPSRRQSIREASRAGARRYLGRR